MEDAEEALSWEAYWHLTLDYFRRWVDAKVVGALASLARARGAAQGLWAHHLDLIAMPLPPG